MIAPHLQTILDTLPTKPGCYLMYNAAGTVIYVGKAINLRNRVRSYFHTAAEQNPKTRELVRYIANIEYIIQQSELEALLLEYNLITKYKPKYNVRWKDDKRYPYIKVHWRDPFPTVTVTREMQADGADGNRYFGPYTSGWAVHQTLEVLRRIFPYLTCDRVITGNDPRACLYHDIKLCSAPCIGAISQASYRAMIDDLCAFLQGQTAGVLQRLRAEMAAAAEALQYERAAVVRDQILAIDRVVEKQKVVSNTNSDSDVVAFARENNEACVQVFFIRAGKLIGRDYFVLEGTAEEPDEEVLQTFLKQFYHQASYVPPEVLLPQAVAEASIISEWLQTRRPDRKMLLKVPDSRAEQALLQMAAENATDVLQSLRAQWARDSQKQAAALQELQEQLGLAALPHRIECYDISNTQGIASVGSMVVFEQGVALKSHYRRFNIRTVQGPNDFESMREVLTRRCQRWRDSQPDENAPGYKPDESFRRLPDLIVIDGGKGQLGVAVEVLTTFGWRERVIVIGLAKREEEIFRPEQSLPILLPRRSEALYLLQRIRDEAHRFGLAAHRQQRNKLGMASRLDAIPGIGPSRRKALLKKFGSLEGIRDASLTELQRIPGITAALAQVLHDLL
jgi:excinuclease ABC subunit C